VRRAMRAKVGVRTKVGIVSFAHMHAHNYAAALGNLGGIAEFVGIADEDSSTAYVINIDPIAGGKHSSPGSYRGTPQQNLYEKTIYACYYLPGQQL